MLAAEPARHVDRHLPRPVQPHAARASPRGRAAARVPDPRLAGPARRSEAPAALDERGRGPLPAARGAVLHHGQEGGGPARARRAGARRHDAPLRGALRRLRRAVPARGRGGLRRAAAAQPRAALEERAAARALPRAVPPHPGGRIPGHQPAAVPLAEAAGRARREPVRGGRRRPVDLRLPRRQRRQHGRLRARLPGGQGDSPGAELPLAGQHPGCRQRANRAQHQAPGQEPVDGERRGRAAARVRGDIGRRRGALDGGGDQGAAARRLAPGPDRGAVPLERAIARSGARPVHRRAALPRLRGTALLRARGDQACARVPAPHRLARGRQRVPARGELPGARHRRAHGGSAAGRGKGRRPATCTRPRSRRPGRLAPSWRSSSRCARRPRA